MINCGVFDEFGCNCVLLMLQLLEVIKVIDQMVCECVFGQNLLFGGFDLSIVLIQLDLFEVEEWLLFQCFNGECDMLGFYFSGYLFDFWCDDVCDLVGNDLGLVEKIWSVNSGGGGGGEKCWCLEVQIVLVGQVVGVCCKGESQIFIQLEDGCGCVECSVFFDVMVEFGYLMIKDCILVVKGGLCEDEFNGGYVLCICQCWDFDEVCVNYVMWLLLCLDLCQQCLVWECINVLFDCYCLGCMLLCLDLLLKGLYGGVVGMLDVFGQSVVCIDFKLMEVLCVDLVVCMLKVCYSLLWVS